MRIIGLKRFTYVALGTALCALLACSGSAKLKSAVAPERPAPDAASDDGPGITLSPDGGGLALGDASLPAPCHPCSDFPAAPVIDDGSSGPPADAGAPTPVPANVGDLFGPADRGSATGGPCLLEPEDGTLFPRNWLRPRFRIQPGAGQTLFELRLTSPSQKNPLVVYTSSTSWTMPKAMWQALSAHAGDDPIAVSVRGTTGDGKSDPAKSTASKFSIAPVDATGSIVYWTTSSGSALKGFKVQDEGVVDVLRPEQTDGQCVGCHTSTPDGLYVGFSDSSSLDNGNPAHPELRSAKNAMMAPAFLTPSAQSLMSRTEQQFPAFSKGHWQPGDHVMLTMWMNQIMWTDLEAKSADQDVGWGYLARTGDPKPAAAYPSFSHDGSFVTYVSSSSLLSAGETKDGDIYRIPFAARKGGAAMPVKGAATAEWNEYYPAPSPDDRFIAFTRVPTMQDSHHAPMAEIFVVPSAGGTAVRFRANDPGPCTGAKSPGITNSWPKWAPLVGQVGDKTYYWLTFSSTRGDNAKPQLYVTPLVVDGAGALATYPAIYLWNQPADENNHTPSWDVFDIPID